MGLIETIHHGRDLPLRHLGRELAVLFDCQRCEIQRVGIVVRIGWQRLFQQGADERAALTFRDGPPEFAHEVFGKAQQKLFGCHRTNPES